MKKWVCISVWQWSTGNEWPPPDQGTESPLGPSPGGFLLHPLPSSQVWPAWPQQAFVAPDPFLSGSSPGIYYPGSQLQTFSLPVSMTSLALGGQTCENTRDGFTKDLDSLDTKTGCSKALDTFDRCCFLNSQSLFRPHMGESLGSRHTDGLLFMTTSDPAPLPRLLPRTPPFPPSSAAGSAGACVVGVEGCRRALGPGETQPQAWQAARVRFVLPLHFAITWRPCSGLSEGGERVREAERLPSEPCHPHSQRPWELKRNADRWAPAQPC